MNARHFMSLFSAVIPTLHVRRGNQNCKRRTSSEHLHCSDHNKVLTFGTQFEDIVVAIENDEFEIIPLSAEERERFIAAASNTGKKDQRMNIRMSSIDINKLKAKALQEGMPYQTLVSSILHKYINNQLHEAS